jgi:hypothetical protein
MGHAVTQRALCKRCPLERHGVKNNPKRIAVMEAIWSTARTRAFAALETEITNDTEVFYPSSEATFEHSRHVSRRSGSVRGRGSTQSETSVQIGSKFALRS